MSYTPDILEELNVLCLFNLATTQEGIKVHSSARPEKVAATRRLHERGLVTQPDGGYLTGLGRDAAIQAQNLLTILSTAPVTT
ncbi:TIGR02647 family protein [Halomonas sp. McH1-25]|uniref:TIGR02647 family protein n=1 Tax=unclassified Halomonas TaxID=2609666 RepID=UPI001EF63CB0|nr:MULTISPECIES: TIGR02647 family protein [unclassified Halomonas]MCG7600351.1 TIGR02647 family protein [Halomonas sp. McH1-25]MCP1344238.1 TIGR02647 family protein [Halomonas sp. FL8]MCP1361477.1 TIGR02647 family protein [Halomonas sp. BBD45]MCP1365281.1 TIGR02647 family protein [Halomonas sp. BBD48]